MKNTNGKTKQSLIFEHVHSAIMSGQYKVGQRIPSETALSRRFSMTRTTVGKALRDLEVSGYLERRSGSGSYVRMPQKSQSKLLGLLVPSVGEGEIFAPICSSIASVARVHHFTLLWGQSVVGSPADKGQHAEELCRHYIAQQVDGVFFSPIELMSGMEEVNRRITESLDRAGIPVVLLDWDSVKYPQRSRHDLVGIDNRRAGRVLAEHLLAQGCRRIDFIYRSLSAGTIGARIAGWQEALRQNGIEVRDKWLHHGEVGDLEFVRGLLSRPLPDAYLCANDYTAAQLMQNMLALGVRVPEDVCVVGVDDVKYANLLSVPLTTIHQPCAALGAAAVDAMLRRIDSPTMPARDVMVDFHLVIRRSSQRRKEPSEAHSRPASARSRKKPPSAPIRKKPASDK